MAEFAFNSMATGVKDISEAQIKANIKRFDKLQKDLQKQIDSLNLRTETGKLRKVQLEHLKNSLNKNITELYNGLKGDVEQSIKDIARLAVNANTAFLANAGIHLMGAFAYVPNDVYAAISMGKVYDKKWYLSESIWGDVKAKQNTINKIVADGIAQNKSSFDIAKDLEMYVDPKAVKPWNWSKVYPGSGKVIDYNAQRLARTLTAHAYQKSLVDVVKYNPFVSGIVWHSAFAHGRTCALCMDRDGEIYKPQDLPLDHPNGLCTYSTEQLSLDATADRLAAWVNGEEDIQLDRYAKAMYPELPVKPVMNALQKKYLGAYGYGLDNLPSEFTEWSHKLPSNVISELQSELGILGNAHPFQDLNKWYDDILLKIDSNTSSYGKIKEAAKVKASVVADKIKQEMLFDTSKIDDMLYANDALESVTYKSNRYKQKYVDMFKKWNTKLDEVERSGINTYTGGSYREINQYLRGLSDSIDDYMAEAIENAKKALDKSKLTEELVVRRGSDLNSFAGLLKMDKYKIKDIIDDLPGTVVKDGGFMSTSPHIGGGFSANGVEYRVKLPKGAKAQFIAPISRFTSEQEVLLQAGTNFVINEVVQVGGGYRVYMTAIV